MFHSIVNRKVFGRSYGKSGHYPLLSLLDSFHCMQQDEHVSYGTEAIPVPPFGCTFSTALGQHHLLAVANEEGIVRLYDTESYKGTPYFREWMSHSNAVFDIAWVPGEQKLVTASGDQTAKLWDIGNAELIGTFKGHQCSLKSVAFAKYEKAVFCTGGRDGNIMVWDTRCNKKDGFFKPVKQISCAHNTLDKYTPSKQKKKRHSARGLAPSVDFQQSVTVVLFQDEHTLVSAGAVDGVIKFWDLRKTYAACKQDPVPSKCYQYPGTSSRKLGYSSLTLDSSGTNLFANCTDDNIYMFNVAGLKTTPVAVFSGHQNSTFYIKSSVSPDDQFLVSGSSDHKAYIWEICKPHVAPTVLQGHSQEVTSVTWCQSDFSKIATCSDDNTVRIWRLLRNFEDEKSRLGEQSLVGWANQRKEAEKERGVALLSDSCSRIDRVEDSLPVSSPRPATCAPKLTGDLPLSSNTISALKMPVSKSQSSSKQTGSIFSFPKSASASEMSIRKWMTQTSNSSLPQSIAKPSSPRKILTPVGQSTVRTVTEHELMKSQERKVKRRLNTNSETNPKEQDCLESCSCVSELDPASKKRKLDLCCLAELESAVVHDLDGSELSRTEMPDLILEESSPPRSPLSSVPCKTPSPSFKLHCSSWTEVLDKENSPAQRNWLTAMSEKVRIDKGLSTSRSGNTPSPPSRSPGTRRQETKHPAISPTDSCPSPMRKISTYFKRKLQD
ncbi:denticleless protein homolog [Protopterus annectens]|uniref:denticleless protein homolog n=1 Tax=Protopterus annectens TaxID=7888 RepID=UPI001CFC01A1|nr:denticleless protein homolog [Protopterus annectens]